MVKPVPLILEGLGAAGELVERRLGGGDVVTGLGDCVSGGGAVMESAIGECTLGSTVALFGVAEIAGDGADGVVVRCTAMFEVGELFGESVDALLAFPRRTPQRRPSGTTFRRDDHRQ